MNEINIASTSRLGYKSMCTRYLICIRGLIYLTLTALLAVTISTKKLVMQNHRPMEYTLSKPQRSDIDNRLKGKTIDELKDFAMNYTCKHLSFDIRNSISDGKANCIGYAQFYSAVFNYSCSIAHVKASARPVVGYVSICSINVCSLLQDIIPYKKWKDFVKNHDFVEVKDNDRVRYIDPSLKDLVGFSMETRETPSRRLADSP